MSTESDSTVKARSAKPFGPIHIVTPTSQHSHTAIFLHGRGSNGQEFMEELLDESRLSDQTSLAQRFPSWRWVFPSSQMLWSTTFQEDMPAWFEAHSLTDITARQALQMPGIADSVKYVADILDEEIQRLDGASTKVILGGMSQGGAIGMWTLLRHTLLGEGGASGRLGAFVGTSTWLPFALTIEQLADFPIARAEPTARPESNEAPKFVESIMGPLTQSSSRPRPLRTPVFLGHGIDDGVVDFALGQQAKTVLQHIGLQVEWKEYCGAELEGHWLKVSEEVDDIADFLRRATL